MSYPRYPKYTETNIEWIGQIPAHWKINRLKMSIRSCRNGVWGDEAKGDEYDVPCIRVADFDRIRRKVKLNDPTVRNISAKDREGRLVQRGDLLLEKSGGGETQPVGCVVMYDDDPAVVCSNFIARMEMADGMDNSYWRYAHAAAYDIRLTTASINQTSGIQNLDQWRYFEEKFPFPPLPEQRELAVFLDRETARIDSLIAEQERLIQLLNEKRQALISHAVTKGVNPDVPMKDSGIEWLGRIPSHWTVCRNKAIFREIDERSETDDGELLTVSHITGVTRRSEKNVNMFLAETLEGYKKCAVGDLVINTMWAWMGALGITPLDGLVSPSYNVYRPRNADLVSGRYFDYLYRTPCHVTAIKSRSTGVWESRLRLYPQAFFNMISPLPPPEEQIRISTFLAESTRKMDDLICEAQGGISILNERRSALISAAVTGKIDVRGISRNESKRVAA